METIPELARSTDVVNGVLNAAAALTGFVLVFLGLAVSTVMRAATPGPVVRLYRRAAGIAFVGFVVGVAVIGLALLWLRGRNHTVYSLTSWFFAGELLLVAVSAGMITWRALRR